MIKPLFAISLMIVFLTGIVGLNFDSHYCRGELVATSVSILPHDLSCGMPGMDQGETKAPIIKKHCCDNEHLSFEINDDYNSDQATSFVFAVTAILPAPFSYDLVETRLDERYEFLGYSPPPVHGDIIIFNQTFLI